MAIVTDVWFSHEEGALVGTLEALPAIEVSVIREASTDPERDVYFFRFDGPSLEDVHTALDEDPTVRTIRRMPEFDEHRLVGVEFERRTKLLGPDVTSAGGYVLDARGRSGHDRAPGWYERWSLPTHESLHTIWQNAREEGFEFEILELHRHDHIRDTEFASAALTPQQRTALVAAYESGYLAEPRETSLAELAAQLDISPSAVSGRITRGMRSLIEATLVVGGAETCRLGVEADETRPVPR